MFHLARRGRAALVATLGVVALASISAALLAISSPQKVRADSHCSGTPPAISGITIHRNQPLPGATAEEIAVYQHHAELNNATIAGSTNIVQLELNGFFTNLGSHGLQIIVNGQVFTGPYNQTSSSHIRMYFYNENGHANFFGNARKTLKISLQYNGCEIGQQFLPVTFEVYRQSADVNCQGSVAADDALLVLQGVAGLATAPPNCGGFDTNRDGQLTIADALHVRRLLAGLTQPYISAKQ